MAAWGYKGCRALQEALTLPAARAGGFAIAFPTSSFVWPRRRAGLVGLEKGPSPCQCAWGDLCPAPGPGECKKFANHFLQACNFWRAQQTPALAPGTATRSPGREPPDEPEQAENEGNCPVWGMCSPLCFPIRCLFPVMGSQHGLTLRDSSTKCGIAPGNWCTGNRGVHSSCSTLALLHQSPKCFRIIPLVLVWSGREYCRHSHGPLSQSRDPGMSWSLHCQHHCMQLFPRLQGEAGSDPRQGPCCKHR